MENVLAVIFGDEAAAYKGSHALRRLDVEGVIALHAAAVVKKNADGTVAMKQADEEVPLATVVGASLGALAGLLGGPVGLGVGAVAGALAGSMGDLHAAGVDAEFADEVAAKLSPGKYAVLAEVSEEGATPVDAQMAALGGTVFRKARRAVEADERKKDAAAFQADMKKVAARLEK